MPSSRQYSPAPGFSDRNRRFIPLGVSSANRVFTPGIEFVRASGAHLWDARGVRYIDYHAGFAPYLFGHNAPEINEAVVRVLQSGESLFGAGPSYLEGQLAELICNVVPGIEKLLVLNTGSEATSLAIRIARSVTQRDHIIVIQGGYNGNHDELACNVFNSLEEIGPRTSPGEYPLYPMGTGTTVRRSGLVHVINFNDLESVRYVCRRYPVAALITEPVLQNIGVVLPQPGYLQGLRELADELGFLLIFDEVKTGFRHSLGGYGAIAGVRSDLSVFGKAIANGYPMAVVGGNRRVMEHLAQPDPKARPFVAGTYNAHPVSVAAAIQTVQLLAADSQLYTRLEALSNQLQSGMADLLAKRGVRASVVRQGSALSFYFMDHAPLDFHDILNHHNFDLDTTLRRNLIDLGIFVFPVATKQWSVSIAHSSKDIDETLACFEKALALIHL